jgi:hypothetical protein
MLRLTAAPLRNTGVMFLARHSPVAMAILALSVHVYFHVIEDGKGARDTRNRGREFALIGCH